LIDHQAGTINLARNIPRAEIVRNMRALARREQNNIVAHGKSTDAYVRLVAV
jgi:hypothetical protein